MSNWKPIATAPKDRRILVWAEEMEGLPGIVHITQWHEDAGFTIDDIRRETHWMELPEGPMDEQETK